MKCHCCRHLGASAKSSSILPSPGGRKRRGRPSSRSYEMQLPLSSSVLLPELMVFCAVGSVMGGVSAARVTAAGRNSACFSLRRLLSLWSRMGETWRRGGKDGDEEQVENSEGVQVLKSKLHTHSRLCLSVRRSREAPLVVWLLSCFFARMAPVFPTGPVNRRSFHRRLRRLMRGDYFLSSHRVSV